MVYYVREVVYRPGRKYIGRPGRKCILLGRSYIGQGGGILGKEGGIW